MRKHVKELIGVLILSAAMLNGCGSGSSSSGSSGSTSPCNAYPVPCSLDSVAYGAGVFVAVGAGGPLRNIADLEPWIEVSTDGIDWTSENIHYTSAQLNQAYMLTSITYGNNGFVATDGVHVLHSIQGINWTIESFQDTTDKIAYVIYDGTRYILYTNSTNPDLPWKVSTDGVNWTDYGTITTTSGAAGGPVWIIHEGGMYEAAWQMGVNVTTTADYLTATSTDGLSWTVGNPYSDSDSDSSMNYILHTGGQYIVFGSTLSTSVGNFVGLVLNGDSMSTMTIESPLIGPPNNEFFSPAGDAIPGNNGLVSNGTVTVALGQPGLFETTDGSTWNFESLDGVVPMSGCLSVLVNDNEVPTCTAFWSGAAAPGGSIVVLSLSGKDGAESTDGVHWVKSIL